jgi:hypothetical protein
MLTIFHHLRTKNCLFSKLLAKKRKTLGTVASVFFSRKKACQTKEFCPRIMKKMVSTSTKQAKHTGKISGRCNFCGGCDYNIKRSQLMWRALYEAE